MTMLGADTDELRRLADQFRSGSGELRELGSQLLTGIDAAHEWQGADATQCKQEWATFAQVRMTRVSDALAQAASVLERNADEQDRASGEGSPGSDFWSLENLVNGFVTGRTLKALHKLVSKGLALGRFLAAARAGMPVAELFDTFINGAKDGGLCKHVGLGKWGRLLGRAFLPLTVATGLWDAVTGGGYDGWRGWATRAFGLGGAAGAGALLIAGAALGTVGVAIAGGAVLLYGAWSLGNYVYDHWGQIKDFGSRVITGAGNLAGSVGNWAGDQLSGLRDWAGGIFGGRTPAMVPATINGTRW
jgi:uncharacterized protein YukE